MQISKGLTTECEVCVHSCARCRQFVRYILLMSCMIPSRIHWGYVIECIGGFYVPEVLMADDDGVAIVLVTILLCGAQRQSVLH